MIVKIVGSILAVLVCASVIICLLGALLDIEFLVYLAIYMFSSAFFIFVSALSVSIMADALNAIWA